MADFSIFSRAVEKRFAQLSKHELYVVGDDRDAVWAEYLASFPAGTNPMFRTRTEHDCSCCKNFVRNVGNVVAIIDGEIETVWSVKGVETPYAEVAAAMDAYVKSLAVKTVYRTREIGFGAEYTRELLENGSTRKWNHFVGKVDRRHQSLEPDTERSRIESAMQVMKRGLDELAADAVETVLDLIKSKALYRGDEFKASLVEFQKLQKAYRETNQRKDLFLWQHVMNPAARFRNTVIGTLVQDLSEGMDLEAAVRAFESKVAPANYKRPTALITPRMVQDAMKTIASLGLESALERRHARLSDVSVNDVLFVDNGVRGKLKGGIEGLLMAEAVSTTPNLDRAESIGIEDFLTKVVPQASSMDMLVKNSMQGNFMSLTAPVHADSKSLFKWGNDFAWSYDGNVTDSIKERVKRAGGDVDARLRVSLAWFNTDDLDLHVHEPSGNHIFFGSKQNKLDVDMNAFGTIVSDPVENVRWNGRIADGTYRVVVHNYRRRESVNPGFTIEVEFEGRIRHFTHEIAVPDGKYIDVVELVVKNGALVDIKTKTKAKVKEQGLSQEKWGVKTETLVKVNTMIRSPNFWNGSEVGNKHWFFILDGCKNPEPTRGIYNEYLSPVLEKHRKVFEVLGDKTKCPVADEQLSGLGFSSTQHETVTVLVKGPRLQKAYNISF